VSPRIKQHVTFSSTADADAARKFFRRCQQVFGGGCVAVVRKTDAVSRRNTDQHLNPTPAPDEDFNMKYSERHPSRWLKAADLKSSGAVVTIDHLAMEEIGEDKKTKPALYFQDRKKALVLNATNDEEIGKILGTDDDKRWHGKRICLYPTTTRFGGKTVDCIRVRAVDGEAKANPAPDDVEVDPDLNDDIDF
jgi:hypothetical protein